MAVMKNPPLSPEDKSSDQYPKRNTSLDATETMANTMACAIQLSSKESLPSDLNYLQIKCYLGQIAAAAFRQHLQQRFYMRQLSTKQTLSLWIASQKVIKHLRKISTKPSKI